MVEKGKGHDSRGARSLATCFPMLWLADQSGQAVRLYYYQQLFLCGNEPRLLVFFSKKKEKITTRGVKSDGDSKTLNTQTNPG